MKSEIKQICKNIEKKYNVNILFAVENGSRAWRMESKDSDYDVRFVFARPIEEYMQIKQPVNVINLSFDKNLKPCSAEGAFVDISGFDIFKFLTLLINSNPTTIEWLNSDIVYYGRQNKVFKEFALKSFNKQALYYHYRSMCNNNYIKYLKSHTEVTYKKYLYAFRGLVNSKWVVAKNKVPPIIFAEAIGGMKGIIPDHIIGKLHEIIKFKSQGKEKEIIHNIVKMDVYIERFLKEDIDFSRYKNRVNYKLLNKELRRIILKS